MGRAVDIRSGCVYGGMDHVCCLVQEAVLAAINDLAIVVDLDQIGLLDEGEGEAEGIDPKRCSDCC